MIHKAAVEYLEKGWPVIPCKLTSEDGGKVNKKPLVKWSQFQGGLPTRADIDNWFNRVNPPAIGMVTGRFAGIFVVDVDIGYDPKDLKDLNLPPTLTSRTPSGGFHMFYRHPQGRQKVKTIAGVRPHIDIRGDGGFVVLPPSTYPDGTPYEFVLDDEEIADAPERLMNLVKVDKGVRKDWASITSGTDEGSRNHNAASIAGVLMMYLPMEKWRPVAWPLLRAWNSQNSPPLPEMELSLVFESIANKQYSKKSI